MYSNHHPRYRESILRRIASILLIVLFVRVVASIVFEYRNYFPANFRSDFLIGKEAFFSGWYRIAFYLHIISGPIVLLVSAFLMFSGPQKRLHHWHRPLGKLLAVLVLLIMLPSGLVMATRALTGPIAGAAFASLSLATFISVLLSIQYARQGKLNIHQRWATRTFILLCSPLLLRLITGATIVLNVESDWTYRFAAWSSWTIPMLVFEMYRHWQTHLTLPLTETGAST